MNKIEEQVTNILKLMGNKAFDASIYSKTESFKRIYENQKHFWSNPEEGSEATLQYWRNKGLVKELHEAHSIDTKWASYLPVNCMENMDSGKKYPLLFVLHGNSNSIYLAETYGYTHIAAREELITIIPENETAENIDRLIAYARKHYPVDWSKVYMVGYSLGGIMTSRHALRWPEKFAAVGIGGMLFANGSIGTIKQHDIGWPGETITEQMINHASDMKIPVCCCMGEQEFLNLLPLTLDETVVMPDSHESQNNEQPNPELDLSSKSKIASINNWRRVAGCIPKPENLVHRTVENTPDIVTRKLGFPFERTSVMNIEGRSHYIGDCIDSEGTSYARFVGLGQSPHWPSDALAEITWEFIRQFARDPETGSLM